MKQVQKHVGRVCNAVTTEKLFASDANVSMYAISRDAARLRYGMDMEPHGQTDHTKDAEQLT
jgi:hypothetical protein